MAAILDLDSTFTRAWLPPMRPLFIGIGLERNRVPSPRFVHPGCTATTSRIQVGEMLLHEGAGSAGPSGSRARSEMSQASARFVAVFEPNQRRSLMKMTLLPNEV
jgi:hypothetical protein